MSFAARMLLRLASLSLCATAMGCTLSDAGQQETFTGPTLGGPTGQKFQPVSEVFEKRCGTLDCHGSPFRPLRIYGKTGLRRAATDSTNGAATTTDELLANYQAIIFLEPEILTDVLAGKRYAEDLTLLRKPSLQEKHKGGQIFAQKDAGYKCIKQWLAAGPETPGAPPTAFNDGTPDPKFGLGPMEELVDACKLEVAHK